MNLEYRINESYDRLTANDREVLNRILRNKAQSAGMNSTELAAFCHVSRTTLIRLFKKLGIGGFAEFRLLLKERAGHSFSVTSSLVFFPVTPGYKMVK